VVLAAVLFVMVQRYIEDPPAEPLAMTAEVSETQSGWLVKVLAGDVEQSTAVTYYVLNPDNGTKEAGAVIQWNDVNENGKIDPGDTFLVEDGTHEFYDYEFTIHDGDSSASFRLK